MRAGRIVRLTVVVLSCVFLWAALLWLLPASQPVRANPGSLFVTVTGSGTACSQAQPCGLPTALAQAVAGDVLYVGAGTYTGSGSAVVTITKGITLYGGWNGAPTGAVVCRPSANRSILNGQGLRRVVYIEGPFACRVDGFTIESGNATHTLPDEGRGGGIYSYGASPVIANNIITGNIAQSFSSTGGWGSGGGVYVSNAGPAALIQGNQVLGNIASISGIGQGGGVFLQSCDWARIVDNRILRNTASITNSSGYGGGVAIEGGEGCMVMSNTIESNQGSTGSLTISAEGGGLFLHHTNSAVVTDNLIRNNVAGKVGIGGGVSANWTGDLYVGHNLVEGNAASLSGPYGQGGGMSAQLAQGMYINANRFLGNTAGPTSTVAGGLYIRSGAFTMTNNIVARNHALDRGGGLVLDATEQWPLTGTVLHNTFADPVAGDVAGVGVYLDAAWVQVTLVNNLFSRNTYGVYAAAGKATLTRNLFYRNHSGDIYGSGVVSTEAITGQDPLLDPDYHLLPGSPAIDAGVASNDFTDIDGDDRPQGAGPDIGADEYMEHMHLYLPLASQQW